MKTLPLILFLIAAPLSAHAEIRLSGEAKMGLLHEQGKTTSVADVRLTMQAATVTDGGVEFGAVVDMSGTNAPAFRRDPPRAFVYMSTGNLTVQAGNGVETAGGQRLGQPPKLGF